MRYLPLFLICLIATAGKKPPSDGAASDANVSIKATVYADPESVQELLGSTLDGHYTVVKIDLTPNKKFTIDHDNFLLRTDKDGEKSHVFEPTQIAGDGALVITTTDDEEKKGRTGGGISMGGMMGGMGGSPGMVQTAKPIGATMKDGTGKKDPVLDTLQSRMLPQKEVDQPISGLLYFPMEKQKVKNLELIVTTPSGKLSIRFSK